MHVRCYVHRPLLDLEQLDRRRLSISCCSPQPLQLLHTPMSVYEHLGRVLTTHLCRSKYQMLSAGSLNRVPMAHRRQPQGFAVSSATQLVQQQLWRLTKPRPHAPRASSSRSNSTGARTRQPMSAVAAQPHCLFRPACVLCRTQHSLQQRVICWFHT